MFTNIMLSLSSILTNIISEFAERFFKLPRSLLLEVMDVLDY